MAITPLITVPEADNFLLQSSDWLSTPEPSKEGHIYNASVYMQLTWTCADVDWSDPLTLDDDLKRACAYYAEADRIGVLFDEMVKQDAHGKLTMEKRKLGTMEKTTQWSMFGQVTSGNPLDGIDSIMRLYCTKVESASVIRV